MDDSTTILKEEAGVSTEPALANLRTTPDPAGPCVMVIFGAAGDLTHRLLTPSLHNLAAQRLLPEEFAILGFDIAELGDEGMRAEVRQTRPEAGKGQSNDSIADWLSKRVYYVRSDFGNDAGWRELQQRLAEIDKKHGTRGNYLFYFAVAPRFILEVARQLHKTGLLNEENGQWRRIVVEKPFGRDLESAKALNRDLLQLVKETQIYRIDHYLGKETVQNIMAFRFGNGIFEPIWNRRYVDHVQITVAETVGVEKRGAYYDNAGALRDMVPNHIMQLVSLTAMEPPNSFAADPVHNEQAKALSAIARWKPEEVLTNVVRGQYGESNDKHLPAYRAEPNVAPNSTTETFVAMKLAIDNWRWSGVPFYLRTGKRMARRVTEVTIRFRRPPLTLFRETAVAELSPNTLVMHIQPDEGISLRFEAKVPGPVVQLNPVEMKFAYADYFGRTCQTGYETLLYDSMIGDATLFQRADMIEAGWEVVTPILEVWAETPSEDFPNYPAGSWGPAASNTLLLRDGREWRLDGDRRAGSRRAS
jgi:glucose-6-phosphate 1-dehydrogenase